MELTDGSVAPLEVKTGRKRGGAEHQGQVRMARNCADLTPKTAQIQVRKLRRFKCGNYVAFPHSGGAVQPDAVVGDAGGGGGGRAALPPGRLDDARRS